MAQAAIRQIIDYKDIVSRPRRLLALMPFGAVCSVKSLLSARGGMKKEQYIQDELNLLLGWIQAADARISLILPLSSAMLGVIAALAPGAEAWTIGGAIFSSIAGLLLIAAIAFSAIACFPRTNGPKGSMIFFSGINSMEESQYKARFHELTDDDLLDDLLSECYVNAQIAHIKFSWIKRSLLALFLSVLPWFVSVYLLYGSR